LTIKQSLVACFLTHIVWLAGVSYSADFLSLCVLVHLLWPTRSYFYFNLDRLDRVHLDDLTYTGITSLSVCLSLCLSVSLCVRVSISECSCQCFTVAQFVSLTFSQRVKTSQLCRKSTHGTSDHSISISPLYP